MMKTSFLYLCFILFSFNGYTSFSKIRVLEADENLLKADLKEILLKADLKNFNISVNFKKSHTDIAKFSCSEKEMRLTVYSDIKEKTSTMYYGLQKLGFLFPHPRIQISPKLKDIKKFCGKAYQWRPTYQYRGFHFHTMHPNEWVHGFLLGKTPLANDSVKWLARNMQNVFDVSLLRSVKRKKVYRNLKEPFALAKRFGIHAGVNISFALQQQRAFRLISPLRLLLGFKSERKIKKELQKLIDRVDVSFITFNAGTSEFTKTNYKRSIKWMNFSSEICEKNNVQMFMNVHVSSNQIDEEYGNFNFLPQFANENVGVWAHTVMFYGLYDKEAPMYGNKNFSHIKDFLVEQKKHRPAWYYPETSYFIALDVDVPLLLTDYLTTRAEDMRRLSREERVEGHVNFTTGHEVGYWLFDWSVALHANGDYNFDPLISLKLLGENTQKWKKILEFQNKYFKKLQGISILTGSTIPDELSKKHRILERNTLIELVKDKEKLLKELSLLREMNNNLPEYKFIKNKELRSLMEITLLRIKHALRVRLAIFHRKDQAVSLKLVQSASHVRSRASYLMKEVRGLERYPEAMIYERHKNPTSYSWGYAWPAYNLHFWHREEEMVAGNNYNPFFMNIYNLWKTIF